MNNSSSPICFRIRPYPRSRYFAEVVVCDTKRELRDATIRYGGLNPDKWATGVCIWTGYKRPFTVCLMLRRCIKSRGYVAHELNHVAHNYGFIRFGCVRVVEPQSPQPDGSFVRKVSKVTDPDEVLCYTLENLVNQFYGRFEVK